MIDYQRAQVVTTTGSREVADTLAHSAVGARVAACAQVVGVDHETKYGELSPGPSK